MDPMLIAYLATQLGGNIAGEYDKSGNKTFAAGARDAYTPLYQASQFQNMMQKWLGGGASIKLDKDTFKLDMPTTAFSQGLGGATSNTLTNTPSGISSPDLQKAVMAASPNTGPSESVQTGNGGMQSALPLLFKSMLGGSGLGPSNSLPEIPLTGLVGLTPDHLAQVMKMKMMQEQLGQNQQEINAKNLNSLLDYNAQMSNINQQAPVTVPGLGPVSLEFWKSMPSDDREYALYYSMATKLGDSDIMSRNEYLNQAPTDREKFLRAYMKDPELKTAALELARESRTSISLGEKLQYAKKVEEIRNRSDLNSTKLASYVNSKWAASPDAKDLWEIDDPKKRALTEIKVKKKLVEEYISSTGGKVIDTDYEGDNIIIYKVKFSDGDEMEVRYAL